MLQCCFDARFNVAAPVETRFSTAAENINCAEEITPVCLNDAHCPSSEIINFLNRGDDILVKVSCQRQQGMSLALVKCTSPKELCVRNSKRD